MKLLSNSPGVDKISSFVGVGSLGFRFKNGSQIELVAIEESQHSEELDEFLGSFSVTE